MKNLLCAFFSLLLFTASFSQSSRIKAEKYPSLLWEISGRGLARPSYLFGTMHVSSKMVFNLSDSFYLAIKRADVVALETNPGNWQENFSRYDMEGENFRNSYGSARNGRNDAAPQDFLSINSLKLLPYEKAMEAALYSNPSIINSFLYRSNSENSSDFEEDTYLDLHIFQTGRKLGKKICGVEDFDGSMQLVKEAYADAAKEKKKSRSFDYDDEFSYTHMEEAYRSGNLDLLDTINKVNSQSAAFDEKFLYRRNEIQAASIDSILKSGSRLFVGVGAAHLPGTRGVIEILRSKGYRLRPVKIKQRDGRNKENLEGMRVPVQFSKQTAEDGFYTVAAPGKLYNFGRTGRSLSVAQYADMVNGSYYIVTRFATHAAILGQSEAQVTRKLDSVLYENIPGKILSKKALVRNGYHGYDITNRTRRGDLQRYNIFVTPFELLIFKMSGNGDYVKQGTEAEQFFGSIVLKEQKTDWKKWSPESGGFDVDLPHQPMVFADNRQVYAAYDAGSKTAVEIIRTDVHNYDFLEEDSFDLNLMEESLASSENISRNLSRQWVKQNGYPALEATYKCNDSSVLAARLIVQGPHYYTVLASAATENRFMTRFLHSFTLKPFVYPEAKPARDTALLYTVQTPVPLEKKQKLQFYADESVYGYGENDDDSLVDNGTFKRRVISSSATGEKILVSYYRPSAYFSRNPEAKPDSATFKKEWLLRRRKTDTLANGLVVTDYELGKAQSSRMLMARMVTKDGIGYKLETQLDTLSQQSAFIRSFFQSFAPLDTFSDVEVKKKKTGLFFSQFFSSDSVLHRKAVKNVETLVFDSADFSSLKRCLESLTWKEKQYLLVKKELIGKLALLETAEASDYLKRIYEKAGDTVELQYAALEALIGQQTAGALQVFGQIMQADPPVVDRELTGEEFADRSYTSGFFRQDDDRNGFSLDGAFLDNLSDSLELTAGIFKNLLPLINLNDYEQPVMELMGALVNNGLLRPADYDAYLPKLLLEARQLLKKQVIRETAQAIEQAKKAGEDKGETAADSRDEIHAGNHQLSLYATLLLPFWEQNPQVPQIIGQLLHSSDRRLKYNTAVLLLRNGRPVPDSLWGEFAALDEYRFRLYTDLEKKNKLSLFPVAYKSQLQLARSWVLSQQAYNKPDTLVFLQTLPVQYRDSSGWLYCFKYKEKKDDNTWKLATAGLFPKDTTQVLFSGKDQPKEEEAELNFTALSNTRLSGETSEKEQLEKLRKRLLYSRRKSATQFYNDDDRYGQADFGGGRY